MSASSSVALGSRRVRPFTRWAVGVAVAVIIAMVAAYSLFAVAWVVNGEDGVSDNWVGWIAGSVLLASLVLSLAAFLVAVLAMARRERPVMLWLPLWLFPALAGTVALLEIFVLE
jgi:hypothetical protein